MSCLLLLVSGVKYLQPGHTYLKPCIDIASNLVVIDLRLDIQIACDGLHQKFQNSEHLTCDPLIFQPVLI